MVELGEILKTEMQALYVGGGLNAKAYILFNDQTQVYGVNAIDTAIRKRHAGEPLPERLTENQA